MRYPGGKGKTYHHVINLMPPHRVYIETHLGGGSVMRYKAPAAVNIALDIDEKAIAAWSTCNRRDVQAHCVRAEDFLAKYPFIGGELLYVDPPYHPETRLRSRVYTYDYTSADHERLLDLLVELPCMVVLSGYAHPLYSNRLRHWQSRTFRSKSHTDVRQETLWFNFAPPSELHDSRHRGETFRERQTNQRRLLRLQDRVRAMDPAERSAFARWLHEAYPTSGSFGL